MKLDLVIGDKDDSWLIECASLTKTQRGLRARFLALGSLRLGRRF
jgi:hypothetical protein